MPVVVRWIFVSGIRGVVFMRIILNENGGFSDQSNSFISSNYFILGGLYSSLAPDSFSSCPH